MSDANFVQLNSENINSEGEILSNEQPKGDGQAMKRPGTNHEGTGIGLTDKRLAPEESLYDFLPVDNMPNYVLYNPGQAVKRQAQEPDDDSDACSISDGSESPVILQEGEDTPMATEEEVASPVKDVSAVVPALPGGKDAAKDSEYKGSYTWEIHNFSKVKEEKLYSEKFEIGTYTWRLLIFPRGNKSGKQLGLSVYLDAPEAEYTPVRMTPKAEFSIQALNKERPHQQTATHTFRSPDNDWGFTDFLLFTRLYNPEEGFLEDDTLRIRVNIEVQRDERYAYDSKKETGFVGLKNQGATCYMNSLLQSLFHLPAFRMAVYHMPVPENEEPCNHLPMALQCLFYKLQYSRFTVSTKDLTKSFGWGHNESFMQHDVQELNRVLCEKLEEKMKGTKVEKAINRLFEGYMYNFIKCKNVDYTSTRSETFMDLQLDVKGCPNVYASFDKFCQVETLDGDNKYMTDDYGLQDAEKGILFTSFPPVLQLQLKRYEYDFYRDVMVKINDRYEFDDVLDLNKDKYLARDADRTIDYKYRLHSVLVHCGGVHGGHYLAYIRPDGRRWYKFDDDFVAAETDGAIEEKFGGKESKVSNAYLLVYVREGDWNNVMCPVTEEDVAEHLRLRLKQELKAKEEREKQKAEAHLYFTLRVAREEDVRRQVGTCVLGLVDYDKLPAGDYRVHKTTRFVDFKQQVAAAIGVPAARQRFWVWQRDRNNGGKSLYMEPIPAEKEHLSLMDFGNYRERDRDSAANKAALLAIKLYLEVVPEDKPLMSYISGKDVLIFVKYYDYEKRMMQFITHVFVSYDTPLLEFIKLAADFTHQGSKGRFYIYHETPHMLYEDTPVNSLDYRLDVRGAGLTSGSILIVQAEPPEDDPMGHVQQYLQYLQNRRVVDFRRLSEPKEPGISLELMHKATYQEVCLALFEELVDRGTEVKSAQHLRLTQHNVYTQAPQRAPLRSSSSALQTMLQHGPQASGILYFEVLDRPLHVLEQVKAITVFFYTEWARFLCEATVEVSRKARVEDLLRALAAGPLRDVVPPGRSLMLLKILSSRIYEIVDEADPVENLDPYQWDQLRVEVAPDTTREELDPIEPDSDTDLVKRLEDEEASETFLLICAHVLRREARMGSTVNFGEPFLLSVRGDETLASLKKRIQAKLKVTAEELAGWDFAIFSRQQQKALEDDSVVAGYVQGKDAPYLGMIHEDKGGMRRPPTSTNKTVHENSIKISSK